MVQQGDSAIGAARDLGRGGERAALLFLRVFRSLDALVGGNEASARAWLQADNRHLGGVPLDRMKRIEGLVDVAEYLDAMRGTI